MKLCFLLMFYACCINVLCQSKENVYDTYPEDNWHNINKYAMVIHHKVDSVFASTPDLYCGSLILAFTIDSLGRIDSCRIVDGFNTTADTLVVNTVKGLNFKEASVFSWSGKPLSMRFALPIKIDNSAYVRKKNVLPSITTGFTFISMSQTWR